MSSKSGYIAAGIVVLVVGIGLASAIGSARASLLQQWSRFTQELNAWAKTPEQLQLARRNAEDYARFAGSNAPTREGGVALNAYSFEAHTLGFRAGAK